MKNIQILNIPIATIPQKLLEKVFATTLHKNSFHHIATVNPEFLIETLKSQEFFEILKQKTFLNICDGFGIQLAGLFSGKKIPRITGVQVAETLCKICEQEKKSIALIGGFGVVEGAKKFLEKKYPRLHISSIEDGTPNTVSEKLKKSHPDAILVAFGSPAQEKWLQKYGKNLGIKIGIGVGGTFDFWSKKRIRAPKTFQMLGIEWVWRLIQEPSRWKRILNAVVLFPIFVCKQKIFRFFDRKI